MAGLPHADPLWAYSFVVPENMSAAARKAWKTRRANELAKTELAIDRRYRVLVSALYNPLDYFATGGGKLASRRVHGADIRVNRRGRVDLSKLPGGDYIEHSDRQIAAALQPRKTGRENCRKHVEQIVAGLIAGELVESDTPLAGFDKLDSIVAAIAELEARSAAIRKAIYDAAVAEYGTGDDIPF